MATPPCIPMETCLRMSTEPDCEMWTGIAGIWIIDPKKNMAYGYNSGELERVQRLGLLTPSASTSHWRRLPPLSTEATYQSIFSGKNLPIRSS
jgi:hypothetical protein